MNTNVSISIKDIDLWIENFEEELEEVVNKMKVSKPGKFHNDDKKRNNELRKARKESIRYA